MEPIIYKFIKPDKTIKIPESNFIFDTEPSPKLIKYGFNQSTEKMNVFSLIENPHYKNGLSINFDRTDKNSAKSKWEKIFTLSDKILNLKNFCTWWEILCLFGLLNKNQTILSNKIDLNLKSIIESYQKIFKSKSKLELDKKSPISLIIQTYSEIDLDENAYIHLLLTDLPDLFTNQITGSTMILQIFSIHTNITVQLIYYLSSLYTETYIIKPSTTSKLSEEKYLVLINLISKPDLKIPKFKPHTYLSTINIQIPQSFVNNIQCMNSVLIPMKFSKYYEIKTYVDSNIFEGDTYDKFMQIQNENIAHWFDTFVNQSKIDLAIKTALDKTESECDYMAQWAELYV